MRYFLTLSLDTRRRDTMDERKKGVKLQGEGGRGRGENKDRKGDEEGGRMHRGKMVNNKPSRH